MLDDSTAMNPERKLSSAGEVRIKARISKSGSATPSVGDFEGITAPVRPDAKGLKILINSQRK